MFGTTKRHLLYFEFLRITLEKLHHDSFLVNIALYIYNPHMLKFIYIGSLYLIELVISLLALCEACSDHNITLVPLPHNCVPTCRTAASPLPAPPLAARIAPSALPLPAAAPRSAVSAPRQ